MMPENIPVTLERVGDPRAPRATPGTVTVVGTTQQTDLDADRLKAARRAAGLTQAQLAEQIGVSQGRISAWEQGTRRPDASRLHRLASALDVDVLTLLRKGPVTLRVLRFRAGFTQEQLAHSLGMPRSTWSAIERGELALPTDDAAALARLLNVETVDVLAAVAGGAEDEAVELPADLANELDAARQPGESLADTIRRVVVLRTDNSTVEVPADLVAEIAAASQPGESPVDTLRRVVRQGLRDQ
jgi:transcriptional regulator with XRE-family HTH domain